MLIRPRHLATGPGIPRHQRADHRRGSLGLGVGDVFFEVVGVGLLSFGVGAELHEYRVAGLEHVFDRGPAGVIEGAGGGAADGTVDEVGLGRIHINRQRIAPTPLAIDAVTAAIADGGVAGEEDGGEFWIGDSGEIEP